MTDPLFTEKPASLIPPENITPPPSSIQDACNILIERIKELKFSSEFQKAFYTVNTNTTSSTVLCAILEQYQLDKNDQLFSEISKIVKTVCVPSTIKDTEKHNMFVLGVIIRFILTNYGNNNSK